MGITVDISIRQARGVSKRVRIFDTKVEYSVDGGGLKRLDAVPLINALHDILAANYDDLIAEFRLLRTSKMERVKNSARKDLRIYNDGDLKAGIDCYVVKNTTVANRVVDEVLYVLGIFGEEKSAPILNKKVIRSEMLASLDVDAKALEVMSPEFQCLELREKIMALMDNLFAHRCLPLAKDEGELSPRQKTMLAGAVQSLQENRLVEAYVQVWEYVSDNNCKSRQEVFYNAELKAIRPVLTRFMAKISMVLLKK